MPTPPKHGLHRRAFLQTLTTSALLVATPSLPALAAYTIVPTGSIADKRARQLEVDKELKVLKVSLGQLGRKVPPGHKVPKVLPDPLDHRVLKVKKERSVHKVLKVLLDLKETPELKGLPDPRDLKGMVLKQRICLEQI